MAHKDGLSFVWNVCLAAGFLLVFSLVITGVAVAQNPVPLINQPLAPDVVNPGGAGFTLTVNGSSFVSGSVVHWNGGALATTVVSGSELKASVPASDVAQPGTASVTVLNPSLGGGINDRGEITGTACVISNGVCTSEVPAFLAVPCDDAHAAIGGCVDSAQGAHAAAQEVSERPRITLARRAQDAAAAKRSQGPWAGPMRPRGRKRRGDLWFGAVFKAVASSERRARERYQ
jgi:hypothetical protein